MKRYVDTKQKNKKICSLQDDEGSIVVETTISLTVFLFVILIFYSMINICLAQTKIQTTICSVAEGVSKLCYAYEEFEVTDESSLTSDQALQQLQQSLRAMGIPQTNVYITSAASYEDELVIQEFVAAARNGEGSLNAALPDVCDSLTVNYLTGDTQNGCAYLKFLGVVGASDTVTGLDFSESKINGDEIQIVVKYRIRLADYLGMDLKYNMKQRAYTKAWNAS